MVLGRATSSRSPVSPGSNNPAIIYLLHEYADVFADLVFPLMDHVKRNTDLIDKTTKPPKPKQYSPSLTE